MGYFKRFFRRFLNRLSYLHFNGKAFTIFIIYFIVFILLSFNIESKAVSSGQYGNYWGFTSSQINTIDNIITSQKEDYDSFIARYWQPYDNPYNQLAIFFYNKNDLGNIYLSGNYNNYISISSQNSVNNYVKCVVYNLNTFDYITTLYYNNIYIDIRKDSNGVALLYTNRIIYNNNSFNSIFFNGGNTSLYVYPFIENNSSDIVNWSFDTLNINGGDVSPYWQNINASPIYYINYKFYLDITTNGITYSNYIQSFVNFDEQNDRFSISIPRQALSSYFNINDGQSVNFYLRLKSVLPNGEIYEDDGFDLGTYTLVLTTQQVTDINNESDKYTQGSIEENQKETNQKLDNLSSSINDSNISDITNDTLPSDDTQDITADGVNGIFTSIYNAFCTGTPQDIVFPIPFTNKNITLSPNYVRDMLTSSGATFVITIIQAFWWYLISRFIVKDVMNKINKIKSGNIEKIEETNIRGDML